LGQERSALTLELATLQNPDRVERIARQKLGLTRSQNTVPVVMVQEGKGK
jgi:cell division protein FtsL